MRGRGYQEDKGVGVCFRVLVNPSSIRRASELRTGSWAPTSADLSYLSRLRGLSISDSSPSGMASSWYTGRSNCKGKTRNLAQSQEWDRTAQQGAAHRHEDRKYNVSEYEESTAVLLRGRSGIELFMLHEAVALRETSASFMPTCSKVRSMDHKNDRTLTAILQRSHYTIFRFGDILTYHRDPIPSHTQLSIPGFQDSVGPG